MESFMLFSYASYETKGLALLMLMLWVTTADQLRVLSVAILSICTQAPDAPVGHAGIVPMQQPTAYSVVKVRITVQRASTEECGFQRSQDRAKSSFDSQIAHDTIRFSAFATTYQTKKTKTRCK